MARRRFDVIDVVEVLQHWHAGRPKSVVASSLGVDPKTVRKYVAPAEEAGLVPGGPALSRAQWLELVRGWFPELVDARARSLTHPVIEARELLGRVWSASAADVLGWAEEGGPKLWLTHRGLDVRRRREATFTGGAYTSLAADNGRAENVVAYVRGGDVAVIGPRLVVGLGAGWGDTTVDQPPGRWVDALGGTTAGGGPVVLADLLAGLPVALLVRN